MKSIIQRETLFYPAGLGMNPDMMAHTVLKGGPGLTMEQAKDHLTLNIHMLKVYQVVSVD